MNKRSYIIISILLVFGLCICAGCSAQQEKKYTIDDLDNLVEIRVYSAENKELIKIISDEDQLYQYNQSHYLSSHALPFTVLCFFTNLIVAITSTQSIAAPAILPATIIMICQLAVTK